jgi:hypothetical protein
VVQAVAAFVAEMVKLPREVSEGRGRAQESQSTGIHEHAITHGSDSSFQ